uniref:Uncharacterized protein n=1 Tax=Nelumbo nucifera TaxID=4432 RepID=A0A822ZSJ4_NELNU|nr:TPA_asm: hypothetical protein HUJ06_004539 [Nelumbo nucifera]
MSLQKFLMRFSQGEGERKVAAKAKGNKEVDAEEVVSELKSVLDHSNVERLSRKYHIPNHFTIRVPKVGEKPWSIDKGKICVHEHYLRFMFCFHMYNVSYRA